MGETVFGLRQWFRISAGMGCLGVLISALMLLVLVIPIMILMGVVQLLKVVMRWV